VYNVLHSVDHPVLLLIDSLPALDIRPAWTIEHEEREERSAEQPGTAEEQRSQLGILSLLAVCRMEEPDRGIDADAQAAPALVVALEAVDDREVRERPWLTDRSNNLLEVMGSCWQRGTSTTHVPEPRDTHEAERTGALTRSKSRRDPNAGPGFPDNTRSPDMRLRARNMMIRILYRCERMQHTTPNARFFVSKLTSPNALFGQKPCASLRHTTLAAVYTCKIGHKLPKTLLSVFGDHL
jgi:hypothetical protein